MAVVSPLNEGYNKVVFVFVAVVSPLNEYYNKVVFVFVAVVSPLNECYNNVVFVLKQFQSIFGCKTKRIRSNIFNLVFN